MSFKHIFCSLFKFTSVLFTYFFDCLNPHIHKMGPKGLKHYIFGDRFYSKNAQKLRFIIFLHFYTVKYMISYLCSDLVPAPGTHNWNKIHNFLWIRSVSSKIMRSYVFQQKNGGILEIWAFWHFSSKPSLQIYCAWANGDPKRSCFCCVMSLSEET